jgi:hypothetical protein
MTEAKADEAAIPPQDDLSGVLKKIAKAADDVSEGLAEALAEPRYPIHHLDFETFMPAVPRYPGKRPYQILPFQWSDHIEHSEGRLVHAEYLCRSNEDPRRVFAESLLDTLSNEGSSRLIALIIA